MTKPTVPTDLSVDTLLDSARRAEAGRMAVALSTYCTFTSKAMLASNRHGDEHSARGFPADAKAALHAYPDLLVMVEGKP